MRSVSITSILFISLVGIIVHSEGAVQTPTLKVCLNISNVTQHNYSLVTPQWSRGGCSGSSCETGTIPTLHLHEEILTWIRMVQQSLCWKSRKWTHRSHWLCIFYRYFIFTLRKNPKSIIVSLNAATGELRWRAKSGHAVSEVNSWCLTCALLW
jgi:hypothetical protein